MLRIVDGAQSCRRAQAERYGRPCRGTTAATGCRETASAPLVEAVGTSRHAGAAVREIMDVK